MVLNQQNNSDLVYCNEHGRLIHRDNVQLLEENNREHNIKSAGYSNNPEEKSILQAGLYDRRPTEQERFETFLAFMEDRDVPFDLPKRRNVMQGGLIKKKEPRPATDFEMLQDFMRFGGFI